METETTLSREQLLDGVKSTLVNLNIAKNVLDQTKPGPQLEGHTLDYLRAREQHLLACSVALAGLDEFYEEEPIDDEVIE